jgi:hypothetical protein
MQPSPCKRGRWHQHSCSPSTPSTPSSPSTWRSPAPPVLLPGEAVAESFILAPMALAQWEPSNFRAPYSFGTSAYTRKNIHIPTHPPTPTATTSTTTDRGHVQAVPVSCRKCGFLYAS